MTSPTVGGETGLGNVFYFSVEFFSMMEIEKQVRREVSERRKKARCTSHSKGRERSGEFDLCVVASALDTCLASIQSMSMFEVQA